MKIIPFLQGLQISKKASQLLEVPKDSHIYPFHIVYLPDMDCFLCRVFSVLYCSVTLYCPVLIFFFCIL
jgi:hypothetical protein